MAFCGVLVRCFALCAYQERRHPFMVCLYRCRAASGVSMIFPALSRCEYQHALRMVYRGSSEASASTTQDLAML